MSYLWLYILGPYFVINLVISIIVYRKYSIYKKPKFIKTSTGESVDIHEEYHEFKRYDNISFLRILFGTNFLMWIRIVIFLVIALNLGLILKIFDICTSKNRVSPCKRFFVKFVTKIHVFLILFITGFLISIKKSENSEKIYKKILGENYEISYNGKYSSIISNHISWIDILTYLYLFVPSFISKIEVLKIPIVGMIARLLGCIFVDRANRENKQLILEKIHEKQSQIYEGKSNTPLLIFPEGTVSSGKCLLEFKKGAFESLYPLKPFIIKSNNNHFDLSCGSLDLLAHSVIFLSYFYHNVEIIDLPIISPYENMFNFSNEHNLRKEKWEIYANYVKDIMAEIGWLVKSNKSFKQNIEYQEKLHKVEDEKTLAQEIL